MFMPILIMYLCRFPFRISNDSRDESRSGEIQLRKIELPHNLHSNCLHCLSICIVLLLSEVYLILASLVYTNDTISISHVARVQVHDGRSTLLLSLAHALLSNR